MKYFIFFTILIVLFYLLGFSKKFKKFQWMDRNYTTAVKGFSILTVVWAHLGGRLGVDRIQFIAGIGVALFLLCSGYGLEVSYERNGLGNFWKKRLIGVCLPFWIVELIGLLITKNFSIKTYLFDCFFLKPATGYGWFMGYIIVCYLIFYIIKRLGVDGKRQIVMFISAFSIWFVLETVFYANPTMPFLRARQMFSFPCGIVLAMNKIKIEQALTKKKSILILAGGGIVCALFMAITQLNGVKNSPYLVSNTLSLLTCLPMAIGIVICGKTFIRIFENKMLVATGVISYEIYLVHAFTLDFVANDLIRILVFLFITLSFAILLNTALRKIRV